MAPAASSPSSSSSAGPSAGCSPCCSCPWSSGAPCATSFEFARVFRCHDYRSFFKRLLGRGWPLFEICYLALLLLILGVIAAAAGSMVEETFGLSYAVGTFGMMAAVGYLVFRGSGTIEKVLASWSFVLYATYVVFFVWSFSRFGDSIVAALASGQRSGDWILGGVEYAAYNLAIIPAVLFATRHLESRKEAVSAGLLTGPIAIFPGLLFYLVVGHLADPQTRHGSTHAVSG